MKGLDLAGKFYFSIIKPLLDEFYPNIQYTAGLIGSGSEILGYDDIFSQDHHWGVRIQLFLSLDDFNKYSEELKLLFRNHLPVKFLGYSTHWSLPDLQDNGNQFMLPGTKGNINHRVEIFTVEQYLKQQIGFSTGDLSLKEWCVLSEHQLLELVEGKIFRDDLGSLSEIRKKFAYYPKPIWILKMVALWNEVQEMIPLMGRTGFSGDNLGSQLLSNYLVYLGIRLIFTIRMQYAPYPKWFGKRFTEIDSNGKFQEIINQIFYSKDWNIRQKNLIKFFIKIGENFNKLNLIEPFRFQKKQFFNRPHYIIDCEDLINKLRESVKNYFSIPETIAGTINELIMNSQIRDRPNILKNLPVFINY